jgi:tetratricopeptide (TPR) repeat protein
MKPACQTSHPQILAGKCPWCDSQIGDPQLVEDSTGPIWNVSAMAAALDDSSENVRSMTVMNLTRKGPPLDQAIPLLSKALRDRSEKVGRRAEQMLLSRAGRQLTAEDTQRIEAQMAGSPHELALRILALGYYLLGQRESDTARSARQNHIFWLIEHAPASGTAGSPEASILNRDDPQAYVEARSLWLDQVASHPRDTNILGNAAQFFVLNDFEQSEKLLKQARALEPDNPEWPERLGQLYSLRGGRDASDQRIFAASALREFQAAERLQSQADPQPPADGDPEAIEEAKVTTLLMLIHKLPKLAKTAFDAGEFEHARNYATELLEKSVSTKVPEFFRNDGNALHHGNLILGRVALRSGDLEQAKRRLVAAAKVSGSPQLDSFGPNMSLALELLEQGERDVVLEYFRRCGTFWKLGADRLQEWTSQVEKGVIPDFGPNLRY